MHMRPSICAFLLIAAAASGCVGPRDQALDPQYARLPDKELWFSMRQVSAFMELRCQGLTPKQAKEAYDMRFGARERRIDAAMLAKYGPLKEGEGDFIPIGKKCPAYRGAIRQSEAIQRELERRLGLTSPTPAR